METKLKLNCEKCNKEIIRYKSELKKRVFCSRSCMAKSILVGKGYKRPLKNKSLIPCSYCNSPVYRWRHELKNNRKNFCNRKCFGKWNSLHLVAEKSCNWKGGEYSTIANTLCNSRYRRIRKSVVLLDSCECQMCGIQEMLEVHHIIGKGKNPALIYDVTNMITLFKMCHISIRGNEEDYVGFFDGIVANRMNSGNPERENEGNPEPSLQSKKVQRLPEDIACP